MLIVVAVIFEDQRFGRMKEEDAAQHIVARGVSDYVGRGAVIANGNPKVMIAETRVLTDVRASAGE